jgi:hypothetical protein
MAARTLSLHPVKNPDFIKLLHGHKDSNGRPLTIEKLAGETYESRLHVNRVLVGYTVKEKPNYGNRTRQKLTRFFKNHFRNADAILASLNWDEKSEAVP